MKLKSLIILVTLVICQWQVNAQSGTPTTAIDGKYNLMTAERSPRGGTTNEMLMQYAERNGQQMLVVAACEQGCTPMVYTFQPEPSAKLGMPVFFNSFGYYMLAYDEDSFISVIPDAALGKAKWNAFRYSNFYSKDASKVSGMNAEKIATFAIAQSEKVML